MTSASENLERSFVNVEIETNLANYYRTKAMEQNSLAAGKNLMVLSRIRQNRANDFAKKAKGVEKLVRIDDSRIHNKDMSKLWENDRYAGCCGWIRYKVEKTLLKNRIRRTREERGKISKLIGLQSKQIYVNSMASDELLEDFDSETEIEDETSDSFLEEKLSRLPEETHKPVAVALSH